MRINHTYLAIVIIYLSSLVAKLRYQLFMPKLNRNILTLNPFKRINSLWSDQIGSRANFTLERRVFHSISFGLSLVAAVYIPYNFYAGLYVGSLSAFVLGFVFFYQFYKSRYHNQQHSNVLFGLSGLLIFGLNYFTNSGIHGSTDLIWPIYLLLVFAITPYRQHVTWLILYFLAFVTVHLVEYNFPSIVQHPFKLGKGQFTDRITAFPITVIAIYIIIKFIRRSYDQERNAAEAKALAVERSKEEILRQKEQLEQSNSEKNKLMSIISHDLRAPLINVQNYLELLNEQDVDSQDRPLLEKALLKSTNNAMEMLSNLLHWSKSQMEGPSVNIQEGNLLHILLRTLEIEKLHASKKDIQLSYHIPEQLMVRADTDMLQLVLRNLISNAIKFTPIGGLITIDAVQDDCNNIITVADNGQGIALEKQSQVFSIKAEPSFGTNNEKGVGLGLVLCKEFIERQGGTINFESEPGKGSTFFISIPTLNPS